MNHPSFRSTLLFAVTASFAVAMALPQQASALYPSCIKPNYCDSSPVNCPCSCPGTSLSSTCEEYDQNVGVCWVIPDLMMAGGLPELSQDQEASDTNLDEKAQPQVAPRPAEEPVLTTGSS